MTHDSTQDTKDHIARVQARLFDVIKNLTKRGTTHDASKLGPDEKPGYDILSEAMAGKPYGSPAYAAAMAAARQRPEVQAAIAHHYATYDHHPEHTPDGIAGMSLLSLIEWVADCKAASERSGGPLRLDYARFGVSDQLARILENTVRELGW